MVNQRYCRNCGAPNSLDAKSCAACGASFDDSVQTKVQLEDRVLQKGEAAPEQAGHLVKKVLHSFSQEGRFCTSCGVKLTRANRKEKTKLCYKCWVAYPASGVYVGKFSSQAAFVDWLRSTANVEILGTSAQGRWSFWWGWWRPNTTLTVTWRYRLLPERDETPPRAADSAFNSSSNTRIRVRLPPGN